MMGEKVTINGIDFVRADARIPGNRAVIVVDRGWIFAGDITRADGRITIARAVWVFRWEKVGFAGIVANPADADIRPIADVDMPEGAEIFSIPVHDTWGL
jgi:hypothetical protein